MPPQDQIRKLAEDCANRLPKRMFYIQEKAAIIEAAILEGVKLALAEPSEEMAREGAVAAMLKWNSDAIECWSAMSAVRLRELGVEE